MSLPLRNAGAPRHPFRLCGIALAVLTGCSEGPPRPTPALVLLRQQLRPIVALPVSSVQQPDDSTLRVVLEEGARGTLAPAERDSVAEVIAARAVRLWPDPRLRRVEIVLARQRRLGPFTFRSGDSRFAFDAGAIAPPPPLPEPPPTALEIPVGTARPAP